VPPRGVQNAANGNPAAGLVLPYGVGLQRLNGGRRGLVQAPGGLGVVIMAKVGADHKAGFGSIPEEVNNPADLLHRGVPDGQRNQGEAVQDRLQEGQLHFQGMLPGMGLIPHPDPRQRLNLAKGSDIHRHRPEGRREGFGGGRSQAIQRNVMGWADQHHPLDQLPRRGQLRIGRRGDRAGVDVAGMGRDQGLGRRADCGGRLDEEGADQLTKLAGIGRIKPARHRGRTDALDIGCDKPCHGSIHAHAPRQAAAVTSPDLDARNARIPGSRPYPRDQGPATRALAVRAEVVFTHKVTEAVY